MIEIEYVQPTTLRPGHYRARITREDGERVWHHFAPSDRTLSEEARCRAAAVKLSGVKPPPKPKPPPAPGQKRAHGTGTVFQKPDGSWYGKWCVGSKRITRKLDVTSKAAALALIEQLSAQGAEDVDREALGSMKRNKMGRIIELIFRGYTVEVVANAEDDALGPTRGPWFVVADLARPLGYRDATDASRGIDVGTQIVRTSGDNGVGRLAVNEVGLYALLMKSRKSSAAAFKAWVLAEVLPSIRKTGKYEDAPAQPKVTLKHVDAIMQRIERTEVVQVELADRLELYAKMMNVKVAEAVKVQVAEAMQPLQQQIDALKKQPVVTPAPARGRRPLDEAPRLTPKEIGQVLGLSSVRVNALLVEMKFQEQHRARARKKDQQGELYYMLIGEGHDYGSDQTDAGKYGRPRLRWVKSTIDRVRLHLQSQEEEVP